MFTVRIIPADVIEQAERYYPGPLTIGGLLAFCRHVYTNYDDLLNGYNEDEVQALRHQVNAQIIDALEELGVEMTHPKGSDNGTTG